MSAPANTNTDGPREKDFENGGHYHLDSSHDPDTALRKIQTSGSISISPELFEKIYLSPQNKVAGDLRKTFGNPTPVALGGFLLSLTPLSCILMGWRGSGGLGASDTAQYFFFGGLLMILGATGEWILGNTFPATVFFTFGAFWLSFGGTLQPFYNAYGAFATSPTNPATGLKNPQFYASYGFFLVFMGLLCFVYLILALRTNVVFVLIFLCLVPAFGCLAGAFWGIAQGSALTSHKIVVLLETAGALTFIVDMLGWWIFAAILLASLDFPFQLPVGDLSTVVKGASDKKRAADDAA